MATTENSVGWELDSFQNGEFTYNLIDRGMLAGQAETYEEISGETTITVEEAWDYAEVNCQLDKPTISDNFEDDLLL